MSPFSAKSDQHSNQENHKDKDKVSPSSFEPSNEGSETSTAGSQEEKKQTDAADMAPKEKTQEIFEIKDLWMRTAAEFENFRKRTRREIEEATHHGKEAVLKDLLPVFDNLERGLQSASQATDVQSVIAGLEMILKQLEETLNRMGILKIKSVGQPFNPAVHEAIQHVENEENPAGTVIAEVHPGYKHGDRLLRAAMVVVSKLKN
ncbi:nucleotide exchange factor GrpE [Pajaroellobacter abortibovis]|uniref:nucleotide exchange factor GrpE n=1 Tax=Pajaroellobacter abortibovis TaxID=1882918 RepID=UPI0009F90BEA|nr:nucleotide exchange factor GrpE [Pajaroellobacter abortibovis]